MNLTVGQKLTWVEMQSSSRWPFGVKEVNRRGVITANRKCPNGDNRLTVRYLLKNGGLGKRSQYITIDGRGVGTGFSGYGLKDVEVEA